MPTEQLLATLAALPHATPSGTIPTLIGALERCKAELLAKLISTAAVAAPTYSSDAELLSIPQVAQRLSVPTGRIYELARQGRLPTVRVGKYVRVQAHVLEAWIVQQRA
jgi:excisionase family DNA binding protein